MAVHNVTFGDPSQPGKLVVKGGQLDLYDLNGNYVIKNGAFQGISGTYYVALTSGGAVTTRLIFTNGILTSAT